MYFGSNYMTQIYFSVQSGSTIIFQNKVLKLVIIRQCKLNLSYIKIILKRTITYNSINHNYKFMIVSYN